MADKMKKLTSPIGLRFISQKYGFAKSKKLEDEYYKRRTTPIGLKFISRRNKTLIK